MSIDFVKLCAAAIAVCALALTLKKLCPEYAAVMSAVGAVLIFTVAASGFSRVADFIGTYEKILYLPVGFEAVIKALGVMLVCEITADVCERAGEAVLAKALTMAGKIEIVVIGLPLFSELLETAAELCS